MEARSICILQLEALTGIAKGLTRISTFSDGLSDEGSDDEKEIQEIEAARQDPRMLQLRENILSAIRGCVEAFHDAEIAQVGYLKITLDYNRRLLFIGIERHGEINNIPTV